MSQSESSDEEPDFLWLQPGGRRMEKERRGGEREVKDERAIAGKKKNE